MCIHCINYLLTVLHFGSQGEFIAVEIGISNPFFDYQSYGKC